MRNTKKGNKKKYRGVEYRSNQEVIFAELLYSNSVRFKYEPYTFEVLEPFTFHGDKVRPISYTPDFLIDGFYVEIKGYIGNNRDFPLRAKLFKKYLLENEPNMQYVVLSKKKEMLEFIQLYKKTR